MGKWNFSFWNCIVKLTVACSFTKFYNFIYSILYERAIIVVLYGYAVFFLLGGPTRYRWGPLSSD